jgi:hypothetical protein
LARVRDPVAAGGFYPGGADELAASVDRLVAATTPSRIDGELRAVVAPHAGYVYSGTVAAAAFATIRPQGEELRVALFGPSHFVPLRGAAVSGADAWLTPLGEVEVDAELREAAVAAGAVVDDQPHRADHALEVELPFLQRLAPHRLRVLPVAVGEAGAGARVIAAVSPDALVVVSTDLSHYLDDDEARRVDRRTAEAVVALDDGAIGDRDACGADALRALLRHASAAAWTCVLIDLRTSADASGDRRRVVGYGAFAFTAVSGAPRGRC